MSDFPLYSKQELETNAVALINECAPKEYDSSGDQRLVLLFKFLPLMSKYQSRDLSWFTTAMKPYLIASMNQDNHIEDFVHILTWVTVFPQHSGSLMKAFFDHFFMFAWRVYDHYAIMQFFESIIIRDAKIGWMHYGYIMIVDKSKKHLRKQ